MDPRNVADKTFVLVLKETGYIVMASGSSVSGATMTVKRIPIVPSTQSTVQNMRITGTISAIENFLMNGQLMPAHVIMVC